MIEWSNRYIALICEGNSEKYYLKILLDHNKLKINRDDLLTNDILPIDARKSDIFQKRYLTMNYDKELVIFLVQDNDNAMRKIKSPYQEKIKATYYFLTTPEIEMLLIHHYGLYQEFQKVKSGKEKQKPSIFLATHLNEKASILKSKGYIESTFSNPNDLVEAIRAYSQKSPKRKKSNQLGLVDLLSLD
ncbi:hypothetical protein [Enterococcus lemanii]|uniref:Uncharacterized protein n=1 Tax=Enterococcus lemanii TaxID=1159752 RepID=A0ABV9MW33_9ENTE|nr:hypothetical protein [Enterococcus lemanii]MBM7709241.1 hypothetical protein [Enterococcus lemanii]